jgi:hypothetical protein
MRIKTVTKKAECRTGSKGVGVKNKYSNEKINYLIAFCLKASISCGQVRLNANTLKRPPGGMANEPCKTSKALQINTGIDNSQSPVGMNVADPFWSGGYTNTGWSQYPNWLALNGGGGAGLTPKPNNLNAVVTFTMTRKFYVCKKTG